ncbi:MAG TPA: hypothetical protein VFE59_23235, partial [Trebonia sp.]|nr:hypothetical protein [Trebonia sp.]
DKPGGKVVGSPAKSTAATYVDDVPSFSVLLRQSTKHEAGQARCIEIGQSCDRPVWRTSSWYTCENPPVHGLN